MPGGAEQRGGQDDMPTTILACNLAGAFGHQIDHRTGERLGMAAH